MWRQRATVGFNLIKWQFITSCSLRTKYGSLFTVKLGCWKVVFASNIESVKEVLIIKSADFAGRPPFESFKMQTLGKSDLEIVLMFVLELCCWLRKKIVVVVVVVEVVVVVAAVVAVV